jgi:hypothetical protein
MAEVRGDKVMGHEPFYRVEAELPVTLRWEHAELTAAPRAGAELAGGSGARLGVALSAALLPAGPVSPYLETFWNSRAINPRFSRFHEGRGWGYSAGAIFEPSTDVRIPVTLVAQAPGGQTQLGIVAMSVQVALR